MLRQQQVRGKSRQQTKLSKTESTNILMRTSHRKRGSKASSTALLPGRHVGPRPAHEEQHPPPPPGGGGMRDLVVVLLLHTGADSVYLGGGEDFS
jgi:hypothetical protein